MSHDFSRGILREVAHRPWPLPAAPWIMTQTWHDLLFAHWRIDPAVLRGRIPPALPIDVYDGAAWIGIVPFHMSNVAPRAFPALPWISAFPELNVRTYVTIDGKPGVYFFSLDATNPLAVRTARLLFHLPYYTAEMQVEVHTDTVTYESRRRGAASRAAIAFRASYAPSGDALTAAAGSLEYFLTERYCLYAVDRRGDVHRLEIHHPPWPLQPAVADISTNTMTAPLDIRLPGQPLLHFSKRQDMVAFPMQRILSHREPTPRATEAGGR